MKHYTASFILVFFIYAFSITIAYADTSVYRSATWVSTDGAPAYVSTSGCQISNDGLYCSRGAASSFANLYFGSFGNLSSFGIPQNAQITRVHMRIKGKTSTIQYAGVSPTKNSYTAQCQSPAELWQFFLGTSDSTAEFHTATSANNLAQCITATNIDKGDLTFRINYSSPSQWSADIDNFEVAFDYTPAPTPTVTPLPTSTPAPTLTPTPTPIPTPEPFLDLPWDYEGKGMSFNDAALAINSYFDHTYPLLSAGLAEPNIVLNQVTTFMGENSPKKNYSRHDGYDYGTPANVELGDQVLAAAPGWATYVISCGGCGNMIVIDHENGYQTRYMHMQYDGLITQVPGQKVWVDERKPIGKVGATGTVFPRDDAGAHIHFGVFQDKNNDGNFGDNIPDGVTDPFGWQSSESDPWASYSFVYGGKQRTGNTSFYLWKKKLDSMKAPHAETGGTFQAGNYKVAMPEDAVDENTTFEMRSAPVALISDSLVSVGPTIDITLKDPFGNAVTFLKKPMHLMVDFSKADLSHFKPATLAIYSTSDGGSTWQKENSFIDFLKKEAMVEVSHLTTFALIAERLDSIAPETNAEISGIRGKPGMYHTDLSVSLRAADNTGGLGVDYTLYKKDSGDWEEYSAPLQFTTEGYHTISYYSVDQDGNIENVKTTSFEIDKTIPEAEITFDTVAQDIRINGLDPKGQLEITRKDLTSSTEQITISDYAGNKFVLSDTDRLHGQNAVFSVTALSYNDSLTQTDPNKFTVRYHLDKNYTIKSFDQIFEQKGIVKVQLNYDPSTAKTTITADRQKTTVDGMKLLKLSTQKGTLNYSY